MNAAPPIKQFVYQSKSNFSPFRLVSQGELPQAQVPAVTAERFRQGAFEELGNGPAIKPDTRETVPSWKANAQRTAWRLFKRKKVGWRIPMSDVQFDCGDGSTLVIPYIRPKDYLEYLLEHCPEVLVGGAKSIQDVGGRLEAFWIVLEWLSTKPWNTSSV